MKTVLALLAFASLAAASTPEERALQAYAASMAPAVKEERPRSVEFDLSSLTSIRQQPQERPQPVASQSVRQAARPNVGSCVCNRTGGDCLCQPASLCAQGKCPALTQLRPAEMNYYFPAPTYCPPGRP